MRVDTNTPPLWALFVLSVEQTSNHTIIFRLAGFKQTQISIKTNVCECVKTEHVLCREPKISHLEFSVRIEKKVKWDAWRRWRPGHQSFQYLPICKSLLYILVTSLCLSPLPPWLSLSPLIFLHPPLSLSLPPSLSRSVFTLTYTLTLSCLFFLSLSLTYVLVTSFLKFPTVFAPGPESLVKQNTEGRCTVFSQESGELEKESILVIRSPDHLAKMTFSVPVSYSFKSVHW